MPGALLAADAGEGGAMGEQGVDERMARVAGGGVDDEAGRLVEDEEIGVLEKDVEGDVLGLEEGGLGGGLGEGDERAGAELFAGFGRFSGERDVALLDEGLEAGAGEVGYFFCEEPVEPVARGACIDSELRASSGMKGGNGAGANGNLISSDVPMAEEPDDSSPEEFHAAPEEEVVLPEGTPWRRSMGWMGKVRELGDGG